MLIKRANCFLGDMRFFFLVMLYFMILLHTGIMIMLLDYKFYVG